MPNEALKYGTQGAHANPESQAYAIDASKAEHRITFSPTKGLSIGSNTIWKRAYYSKYLIS